jgi:hypothetical protein
MQPLDGKATYFNPGIFERVAAYRTSIGQLDPCAECIGYVALAEAEHIGRKVWLQAPGRAIEGPMQVVDCGDRTNQQARKASGWVVDVDWQTAQRWGMRGPLAGVRVYFAPPKLTPECYVDKPCQGKW